ncbi:flippase [Limosilactobacillus reuteri]|uniref:Flippase n=2 Tax=Limosilactobacillus reuteri TaxID=1598 RepID=A0A517D845_LIMRT|nr:flippase [Limosilactobacillus reuteri]
MKQQKSLGINAILNGLQSILNLLFPLITFPYVSRVLSVNGMGIYNFSNTYIGYFLLLAGLGINTYAVREGTKYRDNKQRISEFASQIFSINICSTLLAYILLVISLILFKRLNIYSVCILIFSIQILFTTLGINWLYIIYEDYAYITVRNIIFKIFSIILLFIFVRKPNDFLVYAGITVLASVGSNILNFFHAKSFINLNFTLKFSIWKHLKPILIIFASAVGVSIYLYSDNTILGLIKGDYAVGLYSVATKIYKISEDVLSAVLTVTIPRLSMLYGKKMYEKYSKLLAKLFNLLLIFSLPATVGLAMLSKNIILIIAGEKYLQSSKALSIISCAIIFSLFNWIISDCILLPAKRENKLFITTFVTAIFNIIINMLLIPIWSYDAASLSTVLSECFAMLMNAYCSRDILAECNLSKDIFQNTLESIFGCIFIIIVCYLSKLLIDSLIVSLFVAVIISSLGYIIIMVLLKNSLIIYALETIKGKL